jgi:hypothetical protein
MPFRPPEQHQVTPGNEGRFPGFDVLDEVHRWDAVTAGVVLARLDSDPDSPFFTDRERATAGALVDQLLAQFDGPKIPVVAMIAQRLAMGETDGWFYEGMPPDDEAWRATLAYLDDDARAAHGADFSALERNQQAEVVQAVQEAEQWHGLNAGHVWSLWTRYACAAFYSHPWAWNEIGFGGPAYPRGYKAIGIDQREGWEVPEAQPEDPVPWSERAEAARRRHGDMLPGEPR